MHENSTRRARRNRRVGDLRREEGLSLLEVMISLTILAVGLLALLAMQASALKQGSYGRHTSLASQLAGSQMELLKRVPWNDARIQPGGWTAPTPVPVMVQTPAGAVQEQVFNLSQRIVQDANDTNLRFIDVRVTWTETTQPGGTPPRRYAMSSVRHNDP